VAKATQRAATASPAALGSNQSQLRMLGHTDPLAFIMRCPHPPQHYAAETLGILVGTPCPRRLPFSATWSDSNERIFKIGFLLGRIEAWMMLL
jgi:hypothetical protein